MVNRFAFLVKWSVNIYKSTCGFPLENPSKIVFSSCLLNSNARWSIRCWIVWKWKCDWGSCFRKTISHGKLNDRGLGGFLFTHLLCSNIWGHWYKWISFYICPSILLYLNNVVNFLNSANVRANFSFHLYEIIITFAYMYNGGFSLFREGQGGPKKSFKDVKVFSIQILKLIFRSFSITSLFYGALVHNIRDILGGRRGGRILSGGTSPALIRRSSTTVHI